jgi:hypothetical protein
VSANSDFVLDHNQKKDEQRHREDALKTLRAMHTLRASDLIHRFVEGSATQCAAPSHWTLQTGRTAHLNLSQNVFVSRRK